MDYLDIERKVNIKYKNRELLKTAFTHRSYLNESKEPNIKSNERLEFLGDAVLQFLSSQYIFSKYPDLPEGELTNLRSHIVNTESLSAESKRLNFDNYLLISKGEKNTAATSAYIMANAFEAFLGSLYLDQNIDVCNKFLHDNLFYKADELIKEGNLKDPKSLYQEIAQEKFNITPNYEVISEVGPDHEKEFVVGLYLDTKLVSKGSGASKRKAQQDAAKKALNNLDSNPN